MTIDETSLSQGELYTIVTNKAAHGKKGSIVAMIKGTDAQTVSNILLKIPRRYRSRVQEITLDTAASMVKIVRTAFPGAVQVTDRFHVQQLAFEALQAFNFTQTIADRYNGGSDVYVTIGDRGNGTGIILENAPSSTSSIGPVLTGGLVIFLKDGTVIRCINRNLFDKVDNRTIKAWYLTADEINKMKRSSISSITYTLCTVQSLYNKHTARNTGRTTDMEITILYIGSEN